MNAPFPTPQVEPATQRGVERWAWVVVALCVLTWPLGLGVDVQDHDEALYAEIAREMVLRGGTEWWDTANNYYGWFGHPVMTMWLIALSYLVLGVNVVAVRIPAALGALVLVGATYWLGRRLLNRTGAAVAAALCATLPGISLMGHNAKTDMNLAAFLTLCICCALVSLEKPRFWLLTGVLAGLATLTKGAIGLGLPGLVVFAAAAWEREGLRRIGRGWAWVTAGVGMYLLTVLPWNLTMYGKHGMHFVNTQILGSTFERFAGSGEGSDGTTPLYFLHTLVWAAGPLVSLGLLGLLQRLQQLRGRWLAPPWPTVDITWFLIPLSIMSFSAQKLPHYIFPSLPALCILAARAFLHVPEKGLLRLALHAGNTLLSLAACAFALAMVTLCFPPQEGWGLFPLAMLGTAAVVVGLWLTWRNNLNALWVTPCLAAITALALHNGAARPELAKFQLNPMVEDVLNADHVPLDAQNPVLATDDYWRMSIVFNTRRKIDEMELAKGAQQLGATPRYVLISAKDLPTLRAQGVTSRVRGFALGFHTSRLSIPFAMVEKRVDEATPTLLVESRLRTPP